MVRLVLALLGLSALAVAADEPPREARRAFEKAAAAVKARRIDEAVHDLEEAVTLFPAYAEAWFGLGKLRLEQKSLDAARAAFQSAIQADPNYREPYMSLAILEQSAGHWKELREVTDRFLEVDAIDFPQTWLLNAVANYNLGNLPVAEKSAREAERLDARQQFTEEFRLLGLILERRGDYAGEVEQLRTFLKIASADAGADSVRARLAEAERRAGVSAIPDSGLTFRAGTSLAVVRFQVRPAKGDLTAQDIEIREDGAPQKIAVFEGGSASSAATRTVPVEISLLLDCSSSVDRVAAFSAKIFRDGILDEFPNVSLSVYGFSDNLVRFATPTRDPAVLKKAMDLVASIPQRSTPLFGSIADTIRDAAGTGANVVRMLVIFSDGESEWPGDENRAGEAERAAKETGTTIFPVMLNKSGGNSMSAADSIHDYLSLAGATGGKEFKGFMGTDILPRILKAVSVEIRSDYIAGFYVPATDKKKRHQVEVVLRSKTQGRISGGARTIVH
jgi:VWFA-related protein